jgi:polysaccharide pyruvyl transferase CsaB
LKKMKRVVVAGYYGFGNTGDEAILGAMLADLYEREPGLSAVVLAEDTAATAATHGVAAIHWRDVAGIAAAIRDADLVLLGGGGLFQDTLAFDPAAILTPRHHGVSFYGGIPLLAAALGKPCALYAVGIGPLNTDAGRAGTRAAVSRAGLVTVRDAESKAQLVGLGLDAERIHVTADPAFGLAPAGAPRAEARLGVALRHWDLGVDPAAWEAEVARALDAFLDEAGGACVFVPFQALDQGLTNDVAVARRVRDRMRNAARAIVLEDLRSPAETAAVVAGCDVVLGMRLHSIVLAMSAGVAAVALAYDPKVRVAMVEAGAPEQVIALEGVTAPALAAALLETHRQRAAIAGRLAAAAARSRDRARDTARLVLEATPVPSPAAQLRALAASPAWVRRHRLRVALAPPGTGRERAWRRLRPAAGAGSTLAARIAAVRGVVVFPPTIGWAVDLVQRPHHLARAFARSGWIAVFDTSNLPRGLEGFREEEPGVFLYAGAYETLARIRPAVVWTFPYNVHLRGHHPPGTAVVYDWIDDLAVFPQERGLLERNHRAALAEATVVASVARTLDAEARRARPDALYLPNAVDFEHFAAPGPPPDDSALAGLRAAGRPVAGYYGAFARWFDYALLDEVARLRPDWSLLLIGPDLDGSLAGQPVLSRPNVTWIGPRPYAELPRYLRLFDVATIPFRIDDITRSTSPLKLFEYFAGGKPVVTTPMPECAAFPEVRVAATPGEFAKALDAARADGAEPAKRDRLRELGRANSWDARVRAVLAALER